MCKKLEILGGSSRETFLGFLCVSTPTRLCECRYFFTRGQPNHNNNNNNRSHTAMGESGAARCNLGRNLRPVLAERYFSIRTDFRRAKSFFPSCHVFFYLSFSFVLIGLRATAAAAAVERRWKMFSAPHSARSPHILVKEIICWTTGLVLSKINRLYCVFDQQKDIFLNRERIKFCLLSIYFCQSWKSMYQIIF